MVSAPGWAVSSLADLTAAMKPATSPAATLKTAGARRVSSDSSVSGSRWARRGREEPWAFFEPNSLRIQERAVMGKLLEGRVGLRCKADASGGRADRAAGVASGR